MLILRRNQFPKNWIVKHTVRASKLWNISSYLIDWNITEIFRQFNGALKYLELGNISRYFKKESVSERFDFFMHAFWAMKLWNISCNFKCETDCEFSRFLCLLNKLWIWSNSSYGYTYWVCEKMKLLSKLF